MKKSRIVLWLIFLVICLLSLSSCRCDPAEEDWLLSRIYGNVSFIGGKAELTRCYGAKTVERPWEEAYCDRFMIEFSGDRSVSLSIDGEKLSGTYKVRHNGLRDTSFMVDLNNGESFSGTAVSYYGGSELELEFRGNKYEFIRNLGQDRGSEMRARDVQMLIRELREIDASTDEYYEKFHGEISLVDGEYILRSGEATYNLSDALVWCEKLDEGNNLTKLSEILFGECYFFKMTLEQFTSDYVGREGDVFAIYYLEPLPEEPEEPKPKTSTLREIFPWLESDDIEMIKLTREYGALPTGFTKHHAYLDGEVLLDYLASIRDLELREIMTEDELKNYYHVNGEKYRSTTLRATIDGEDVIIEFIEDTVFLDCWWAIEDFPDFPYEDAVMSFVTYTDEVTVYDGDTLIGTWQGKLSSVEFTICNEEHDYTTMTSRLSVVTDFGEITVYDRLHFWYKGQSYVCEDGRDFGFLFLDTESQ